MKRTTTSEYYRKLRTVLPWSEFRKLDYPVIENSDKLEAFWHIIVAGYSVEFALRNFSDLYDYVEKTKVKYSVALTTLVTFPKLGSAIYLTKTQWYELN